MAELTEVWVSVSIKKNLGNYESLGLDAGGKVTLKEADNVKEVWSNLWAQIEEQIEDRLLESGLK